MILEDFDRLQLGDEVQSEALLWGTWCTGKVVEVADNYVKVRWRETGLTGVVLRFDAVVLERRGFGRIPAMARMIWPNTPRHRKLEVEDAERYQAGDGGGSESTGDSNHGTGEGVSSTEEAMGAVHRYPDGSEFPPGRPGGMLPGTAEE